MTARHDLLDEAHAHPAVRDVLAVFPGAKISRVEPLPESSAGKREVRAEEIPWNGLDIEPVEPPAQAPPQVARLGARRKGQPVTASAGASIADDPFPMSEVGDAEFFARCMAGRLLHDHTRRRWFVFDRHHWRLDATDRAIQAAIGAMRRRQTLALQVGDVADRAKRVKWTVAGESETRIRHLLDLAASHPQLATEGTDWDADPLVLGAQNGVVDLASGTLRDGRPEDRVARVAAVPFDAAAECSRWEQFVLEICDEDAALATFLWLSIGYALTGLTTEQCFWLLFGHGSNGKSTLLETLTQHVIPEHAWTMSFPVHTWSESISEYQRAELVGRRLVVAKESEQSKRLNTEFVKSLTGGDSVNARHPYGRPFSFVPGAKFFLACNHRPIIRDTTHGMWRRVRLVPFRRTFPLDARLADVLATEAPGILRWAVEGCRAWHAARDLTPPASVAAATADYQHDSDSLQRFLDARCTIADHARVQAGVLWSAYQTWCEAERVPEDERLGQRTFAERLRQTYSTIDGQRVVYVGVGLREEDAP